MKMKLFLAAIIFQFLVAIPVAADMPESVRVPSDIDLRQGPKDVAAKIDECKIKLQLADGEYFWTSPSGGDAVFYKPAGKFSKTRAPYLFKSEAETYSGVYWDYIKPKPYGEPWAGLRCTAKTREPSVFVEANCPAEKKEGIWILSEAAKIFPKVEIEGIEGKDWDGFLISFDSRSKGQRSIVFCAMGEKVLMGQASYVTGKDGDLESIRKILRTFQFAD